jgi:hypothetical protein
MRQTGVQLACLRVCSALERSLHLTPHAPASAAITSAPWFAFVRICDCVHRRLGPAAAGLAAMSARRLEDAELSTRLLEAAAASAPPSPRTSARRDGSPQIGSARLGIHADDGSSVSVQSAYPLPRVPEEAARRDAARAVHTCEAVADPTAFASASQALDNVRPWRRRPVPLARPTCQSSKSTCRCTCCRSPASPRVDRPPLR